MKTKKLVALILALTVMLAMAGCGSSNAPGKSDAAVTQAPDTEKEVYLH